MAIPGGTCCSVAAFCVLGPAKGITHGQRETHNHMNINNESELLSDDIYFIRAPPMAADSKRPTASSSFFSSSSSARPAGVASLLPPASLETAGMPARSSSLCTMRSSAASSSASVSAPKRDERRFSVPENVSLTSSMILFPAASCGGASVAAERRPPAGAEGDDSGGDETACNAAFSSGRAAFYQTRPVAQPAFRTRRALPQSFQSQQRQIIELAGRQRLRTTNQLLQPRNGPSSIAKRSQPLQPLSDALERSPRERSLQAGTPTATPMPTATGGNSSGTSCCGLAAAGAAVSDTSEHGGDAVFPLSMISATEGTRSLVDLGVHTLGLDHGVVESFGLWSTGPWRRLLMLLGIRIDPINSAAFSCMAHSV